MMQFLLIENNNKKKTKLIKYVYICILKKILGKNILIKILLNRCVY